MYRTKKLFVGGLTQTVTDDQFREYFEQFEEFPSYLFDNSAVIDARLSETIHDIENDPETSKAMHKGIAILMQRLPSS